MDDQKKLADLADLLAAVRKKQMESVKQLAGIISLQVDEANIAYRGTIDALEIAGNPKNHAYQRKCQREEAFKSLGRLRTRLSHLNTLSKELDKYVSGALDPVGVIVTDMKLETFFERKA